MNNGGRNKVWILLFWIALFFIAVFAASCKSVEYVPVPEYHTEIVHHRDTLILKDSIKTEINTILREARPEDSAMIARLGLKLSDNERLLILLQNELMEKSSNTYESHNSDSVRVDSVRVPYPVEKKLSRFQQFCLDYGKIMLGATALLLIVIAIIIVRWIKNKK